MKYPKEYAEKAMVAIEDNYFPDDGSEVPNVALITLAALALHMVAFSTSQETGQPEEELFEVLKLSLSYPQSYDIV